MTSQKKTRGYLIDDRGTWAIRARIYNSDGTCITRSKSTGLKVKDNTKRKAQAMTDEIISKWEEEQESNNNLFSYYVNKWLESKTNIGDIKQNTAESYKVYINAFINPLLGDVPISELTRDVLNDYITKLSANHSPNTLSKHRLIIKGAIEEATLDGAIDMYKKYTLTSPQSIHWPKKEKYEANIICEEEARELLAKIKCEKMVIQTAIILGMCYGLRREEIAGLRWKDIDLEKNTIHICNTVTDYAGTLYESGTKTKSSNRVLCIIPFTADFFNDLMQWQKENNFFGDKVCLYDNGKPVAPAYLSKNIPKTLRKYGYDCVRLHDLRHTSASILANHVPITQVRDFCGHEDSKTTLEIYTHITGADKLNTTNVLEKVFNASV